MGLSAFVTTYLPYQTMSTRFCCKVAIIFHVGINYCMYFTFFAEICQLKN